MSKEKEIVVEAKVVEENTGVVVVEKEGFGSKAKKAVKKHGKKLAVGAGIAALGLLAFMLGKKSGQTTGDCGCDFGDDDFDFDVNLGSEDTEI